jgi:hypothetical protein
VAAGILSRVVIMRIAAARRERAVIVQPDLDRGDDQYQDEWYDKQDEYGDDRYQPLVGRRETIWFANIPTRSSQPSAERSQNLSSPSQPLCPTVDDLEAALGVIKRARQHRAA